MIVQDIQKRIDELELDKKLSYHKNFLLFKKDVIDFAFQKYTIRSFAELGCVWNIDCAYGLYALGKYHAQRAAMVDTHWTESALKACELHKEVFTIPGNLGDSDMPDRVGQVDAVILFDVLLHQVAPDWDSVLRMYSRYTNAFIVVEPIFIASPISVRLLDLGRENYFKNVPHDSNHPTYRSLFEKMYEIHPEHNRIWRDVHHVWQWGITKADLIFTMKQLDFDLEYLKNGGKFGGHPNYDYHAFVFVSKKWMPRAR